MLDYINQLPEHSVLGHLSRSVSLRFPPLFVFRAGEREGLDSRLTKQDCVFMVSHSNKLHGN